MSEETEITPDEGGDELKVKRMYAIGAFIRFFMNSEPSKLRETLRDNGNFHCNYEAPLLGKKWKMTVTEIDIKKCPKCTTWMEAAEKNWYCPGCGHTPLFEEGEP